MLRRKNKGMSENGSAVWRSEYLARIRRFTDEMLDRLNEASKGKDADDKEIRSLRNVVLKVLRIWDKSLIEAHRDLQLGNKFPQVENQSSQVTSKEA